MRVEANSFQKRWLKRQTVIARLLRLGACRRSVGRQSFGTVALALGLLILWAGPADLRANDTAAQNQKNNKKAQVQDSNASDSVAPLSDGDAVDQVVGQMLAAWQLGDVEGMHKFFANDVMVVSGAWEPPLIGWESYSRAYQAQYLRTTGCRLDRLNTYTKVLRDDAWVTYQWRYSGKVDGALVNAVGHTTLVLEKQGGTWLIVLNHTSGTPADLQQGAAPVVSPQPANSGSPSAPRQ